MDRRRSLKVIALSALSGGLLLDACKEKVLPAPESTEEAIATTIDRTPDEKANDNILVTGKIFTEHERKTIAVLSDIIIPADGVTDSATAAKVPQFIETIAIDMPHHQVPLKGGMKWLDMQCMKLYENPFVDCSQQEQIAFVEQIAFPEKAKPAMKQGVSFFNLMRSLVISGFYTSEMGIKDIGYMGNKPNQWNGVPEDVLKQYGLSYTEKELKECISFT